MVWLYSTLLLFFFFFVKGKEVEACEGRGVREGRKMDIRRGVINEGEEEEKREGGEIKVRIGLCTKAYGRKVQKGMGCGGWEMKGD